MATPEVPYTKVEMYLDAIARGVSGDSGATVPEAPFTREEMYLDAIASSVGTGREGKEDSFPEVPFTRREMYLDAIARGIAGGGGGSSGGVLVVHMDYDTETLDKTYREIVSADFPIIKTTDANNDDMIVYVMRCVSDDDGCSIYTLWYGAVGPAMETFYCDTEDDYPVLD